MWKPVLILCGLCLAACTVLLDIEGPPRTVTAVDGAVDAAPPDVEPPTGPPDAAAAPPDAQPPDAQPLDAQIADAGPRQVVVTDLRGSEGTHDGTTWEGRFLRLADGRAAGTFTSQVFEVDVPTRWRAVRWFPWLAYGKPLPDAGARDRGYPGGGVDMQDNVLLLHLDEPDFAEEIGEASGSGHQIEGSGEAVAGVFGGALELPRGEHVAIASDHPAFRFGDGDFTWLLFVRSTACRGDGNEVLLGGERPRMGAPGTHMWLGCQVGALCAGPRGLGGTQRADGGPAVNVCAPADYTDGRWHQVAVVKQGHRPGQVRWYLDGTEVAVSDPVDFGENRFDLVGGFPFMIGAFPRDGYETEATFDEVAIWHRALDAFEIERIAARGLARLTIQVRACVTADCSDDPPFGPDLLDDFASAEGVALHPLELGPSRYLQYRVNLAGTGAVSPQLLRVELVGQPEED